MCKKIKLISKPARSEMCLLLCAAYTDQMSRLSQESCYVIEDESGQRIKLYARNDDDYCRKVKGRNSGGSLSN